MSEKICGSNNLYIKPVEVCSFKALNLLNYNLDKNTIFDDNFIKNYSDINKNFRNQTDNNKYIYEYNPIDKNLCFPIRLDDKDSPYAVNCVIATGNPYFTYDKNKKTCSPISGLDLPTGFEYKDENGETSIYYNDNNKDPEGKFSYKFKKQIGYCENKWYEWITIPNYHFGNNYEKDAGIYAKDDVRRCYKPCKLGFMPYINLNGSNICIEKKDADDGIYVKKMDYSPFTFINLIGNNENTIKNLYYLMYLNEIDNIKENYNLIDNYNLRGVDNYNKNNTLNDAAKIAIDDIRETIWTNIINEEIFDIPGNYSTNKQLITYKHPYFNENDTNLITLRGLSDKGITSNDAILIHTFLLAVGYYEFIKNKILTEITNNNKFDEISVNNPFNINNNLEVLLKEKFEKQKYIDNTKRKEYKHRLANILFKAINICYDNKTDFSKNLIRFTKTAFEKLQFNIIENPDNKIKSHFLNFINKAFSDFKNYKDFFTSNNINTIYETYLKNYIGLEINYYDNEDFVELLPKIIAIQTDDNNSPYTDKNIEETKRNEMAKKINDNLLFFALEKREKQNTNNCKIGEIYDKEKKTCRICKDFCDKIRCKTDNRCNIYCDTQCSSYNKKIKSKCGTSLRNDNNNENENEEKLKKETQLDIDEIGVSISGVQDMIRTGIRIFFVLLGLYLCYIFYQIFGETISVVINFIMYYFYYIWYYLYNLFDRNKYAFKTNMAEYVRDVEIDRYAKVNEKASNL